MAGFRSGRLNSENFPELEFVPELLGCSGVFLLLSLSSLFSLFLALIFAWGKAHPSPSASAGGPKPFPEDHSVMKYASLPSWVPTCCLNAAF